MEEGQKEVEKVIEPTEWGLRARKEAQEIKVSGKEKGVDIDKYVLGLVLQRIIGDDKNCFNWASYKNLFSPENAVSAKADLLERLDWEAEEEVTPDDIREKIKEIREAVSEYDWKNTEEFKQAGDKWGSFRDWVEKQKKERPELEEAEEYVEKEKRKLQKQTV